MKASAFLPVLLFLVAAPVLAEDPSPEERAKEAIAAFRKAWKSDDESVRMDALLELARNGHRLAIEEIGRTALTDPEPDVRCAAALAFAKTKAEASVAGPLLAARLPREDDFPEVQVALIRAIAAVGYLDARDALIDAAMRFLEEDYRFVTAEVMRAFAKLEDPKALPLMLALLRYEGETLRGRKGPRVYAKTDAQAKKIYDAKYKKFAYPKGTPEDVVKWWLSDLVAAVYEITGAEIESAEHLEQWMKDNAKAAGLSPRDLAPLKLKPKQPKKPPKEEGDGS